jgi:hypothetical protein
MSDNGHSDIPPKGGDATHGPSGAGWRRRIAPPPAGLPKREYPITVFSPEKVTDVGYGLKLSHVVGPMSYFLTGEIPCFSVGSHYRAVPSKANHSSSKTPLHDVNGGPPGIVTAEIGILT